MKINMDKDLPKGWEVKKLGEVCDIFNGSTPLRRNEEYWKNGNINWFTIKDIRSQGRIIRHTSQKITDKGFKSASIKILPKRTVLLCCTASVGEFAITEIELTTNQQFNGLVVKNDNQLLPMYLFYFASTLKKKLLNISGKATIDFVSMTKIRKIEIPLPPLKQQQKIVKKLNALQSETKKLADIYQQKIDDLIELKKSTLQKAFNGEL
jgi:restriction endonuclease S subunit